MRKLIIALLLLLIPLAEATAQTRKVYDLGVDFGLSFMQSKMQVKNLFTDTNRVKEKYPNFWQVRKIKGYRWGNFMNLSAYDAAYGEAVWQGQSGGLTNILNSNNHVIIPSGEYWVTVTGEIRGNEVTGAGTGYVGTDGRNSVNTELVVWHEMWNDPLTERHILQSSTWGRGVSTSLYSEGTRVENIAFQGRSNEFLTQKFNSSGIRYWLPGEVTNTDRVYCTNFRTAGIEIFGATPHKIGNISVFDNVIAGVIIYGYGGTIDISLMSGDDNGSMFSILNGWGQTGGGMVNIGTIKSETQVATDARVHRGMVIGYLEGQFGVNIGAISCYSGGGYMDAAFIVDTRSPYYPPQNASLNVGSIKTRFYKNMVMQLAGPTGGLTAHYFGARGDYISDGFSWSSYNGGTFNWNVSAIPVNKIAHSCTSRINFSKTTYPTGCTPYRHIVDGPPRNPTTVYLDEITDGGTPPTEPTPTPCSFTYNVTKTCWDGSWQTRAAVASPSGCVGNPPQDSLLRACPIQPPVATTTAFDPKDLTVVINSADPLSKPMADAYVATWSIPTSNVVTVNLGPDEVLSNSTTLNTARNTIIANNKQAVLLAMAVPSRMSSGQSITSAVTFGARSVTNLTVSELYQYNGNKPFADKARRPTFLLRSINYIRKDGHSTNPLGKSYIIFARENPSQGNPRGKARLGQETAVNVAWNNLNATNVGGGANDCNCLSQNCWLAGRKPVDPVIAYFGSSFAMCCDNGVLWQKGIYMDHVTSTGGNLPSGAGQTPLTWHLDRGAGATCGTVVEPWQDKSGNSPGSIVEQFVNATIFMPPYLAGRSMVTSTWAAVKCPDRTLFVGDPLVAPFAK